MPHHDQEIQTSSDQAFLFYCLSRYTKFNFFKPTKQIKQKLNFTHLLKQNKHKPNKMKTVHISLGSDCSIAYNLQKLNYRKEAFPFDWIITKDVATIIENDFVHFCDIDYLSFKKETHNFPKIIDDWIEDGEEISTNEEKCKLVRVQNKYYNIHFLHDFTDDNREEIVKKYKRRVARFYDVMNDPTIHKKLYRIGKSADLEKTLEQKQFKNYKLHTKKEIRSTDWKREDYDWESWFDE